MKDLETLIAPVVASDGLELVEASVTREHGERVLRVTIERPAGALDLGTIAQTSERISRRLDLEGFDPGPGSYRLEVSSPGIERPLRRPEHFKRRIGDRVKVKTTEPIDGSWTHAGALVSADAEAIVVAADGGEVRVRYDDIASARTVFEWGAEQKRGTR
ncbi:MAG: ribosome maturation factor RimP [Actinomycetota bacterium]